MAQDLLHVLCLGLTLLTLAQQTLATPDEDLVRNLPGLKFEPNFRHYSGYLQALDGKRLHYWLVESQNDPAKDPLVLWFNGGPGCSSLFGMLEENGPFRVSKDGTSLNKNEFSWNKIANVVYLEAPAGVGFSYSESKNYTTGDDDTARNNHEALKDLLRKFPNFKENDFYISGESYAGVYVPTLVSLLLDEPVFNLKGFVIGNTLNSFELNDNSQMYFIFYHGLCSRATFVAALEACGCPKQTTQYCDFSAKMDIAECEISVLFVKNGLSGLDPYNILKVRDSSDAHSCDPMINIVKHSMGSRMPSRTITTRHCSRAGGLEGYLNLPDVRRALHIPGVVQEYRECTRLPYNMTHPDMYPEYKKAMATELRIMMFNGDVDSVCNFLGDEWFVDNLHPKNIQSYKQWFYEAAEDRSKQVGGYYKTFNKRFTYATVKGSGHMVPRDKPRPALAMFQQFLSNGFQ